MHHGHLYRAGVSGCIWICSCACLIASPPIVQVAQACKGGVRLASTDSLKGASGLKVTAVLYDAGPVAKKEPRYLLLDGNFVYTFV